MLCFRRIIVVLACLGCCLPAGVCAEGESLNELLGVDLGPEGRVHACVGSKDTVTVSRYTTGAELDLSFGNDGSFQVFSPKTSVKGMAVDSQGNIVLVHTVYTAGAHTPLMARKAKYALSRYSPSGELIKNESNHNATDFGIEVLFNSNIGTISFGLDGGIFVAGIEQAGMLSQNLILFQFNSRAKLIRIRRVELNKFDGEVADVSGLTVGDEGKVYVGLEISKAEDRDLRGKVWPAVIKIDTPNSKRKWLVSPYRPAKQYEKVKELQGVVSADGRFFYYGTSPRKQLWRLEAGKPEPKTIELPSTVGVGVGDLLGPGAVRLTSRGLLIVVGREEFNGNDLIVSLWDPSGEMGKPDQVYRFSNVFSSRTSSRKRYCATILADV